VPPHGLCEGFWAMCRNSEKSRDHAARHSDIKRRSVACRSKEKAPLRAGLKTRGSTLTSSLCQPGAAILWPSQNENPARAALSRLKAGSREPYSTFSDASHGFRLGNTRGAPEVSSI